MLTTLGYFFYFIVLEKSTTIPNCPKQWIVMQQKFKATLHRQMEALVFEIFHRFYRTQNFLRVSSVRTIVSDKFVVDISVQPPLWLHDASDLVAQTMDFHKSSFLRNFSQKYNED